MRERIDTVRELISLLEFLNEDDMPIGVNYAGIGSPAFVSVEETKTKIEPGEPEVLSLLFSI